MDSSEIPVQEEEPASDKESIKEDHDGEYTFSSEKSYARACEGGKPLRRRP